MIEALPGGDPLAAAMAAGETPSPRIVAAAGTEGTLRPAIAWSLLGLVALTLAVNFWAISRAGIFTITQPKSPLVLEERADAIRAALSLPPQRFGAHGWDISVARVAFIARTDSSRDRWQRLRSGVPVLWFWTRQDPEPAMRKSGTVLSPSHEDPPQTAPGASTIGLDPKGRLAVASGAAGRVTPSSLSPLVGERVARSAG